MNVQSLTQLLDKFCNDSDSFSLKELRNLYLLLSNESNSEEMATWIHQRWEREPDDCAEINFENIFQKVERQLRAQKPAPRRWLTSLQRVAAILILPFVGLSCFLLLKNTQKEQLVIVQIDAVVPVEQEYITPAGMRSQIVLPDSSLVWLNASSRLIVQAGFGAGDRHVTLTGEAYFVVATNKEKPFVVGTSDMNIKALGTAFNVSAYPERAVLQTVLVNGGVEIETKTGSKLTMQPNQLVELNREDGAIELQHSVNAELYTAWTDGVLVFHKMQMEDITQTLERWFNVTIELRDPILKSYRYTGTFDNRSLEQILNYISISSDIGYRMNKDHITLYNKRKQN